MGWCATAESKVEGTEPGVGETQPRCMDCGIILGDEGCTKGVDSGMVDVKDTGPRRQEIKKRGK